MSVAGTRCVTVSSEAPGTLFSSCFLGSICHTGDAICEEGICLCRYGYFNRGDQCGKSANHKYKKSSHFKTHNAIQIKS